MTLVQRALGFRFQLGTGSFGGSGFDTVDTPPGLWATANINKVGSPAYNEADIRIFGLSQTIMNKLSLIGLQPAAVRNNIVSVTAGDLNGSMPLAFAGGIRYCWPDFSNPTDAVLNINANTGLLAGMKTALPTSYSGTVDVATIMGNLAKQMGYTLENNGVSVQLSNPYLPGSARDQAIAAADQAGIYVYLDNDGGIMSILPKIGSRKGVAPTVSPQTGMVGYPTYFGPGQIRLKTEYNPAIGFLGNIVVKNSIVSGANGTWRVIDLKHDLSTLPEGPWFSDILATNVPQ